MHININVEYRVLMHKLILNSYTTHKVFGDIGGFYLVSLQAHPSRTLTLYLGYY